mmetsp:Transcript_15795/g.23114  ORF Transcript_15795/g.23114 Transcript_15795/m.23114 type:complete len:388 (-) Transcript_15795:145-1308(-)
MAIDKESEIRGEAAEILQDKVELSTVFNNIIEQQVPKIDPQEIVDGDYLGEGGFCTVVELKTLNLFNKNLDDEDNVDKTLSSQNRRFMSKHVLRDGQARYAIKRLSRGLVKKSEEYFRAGIVDLAMEVKYLAVIQHPHIIKIRAVSHAHPCSDSYFVVLDKLYDTLTDRIDKIWKRDKRKLSGMLSSSVKKNEHLANRLIIAYDICSALSFLHNNNVIYRDLKPDNIGFDIREDVKIFDFGLAREMQDCDRFQNTSTYKLTAQAGSPRYMAPEVALDQPYNQKSDIYSFGLLLWQICALKVPFADHNIMTMTEDVYEGDERPTLNPKWSQCLRDLIQDCWTRNIDMRPEGGEAMATLRNELSSLIDSEAAANLDISGRTAYSIAAAS